MKKLHTTSNIIIGILFQTFFICLAIFITTHLRQLYYFDIDFLNLEKYSGYSKTVILENYNALMDYCSPFYQGKLQFPSLTITDAAYIHFQKVKIIFDVSFYVGCILFVLLCCIIVYKYKKQNYCFLKTTSIVGLLIPTFCGIACGINWDATFITFHEIFFHGDYWMFDWNKDLVIRLLPDTYFLHCAILMILVVLLGNLITFLIYLKSQKHSQKQFPLP